MSLIHGAAGIQYYCHRFDPDFSETDCLDDDATAAAMKKLNQELRELAPVLNSQSYRFTPVSSSAAVAVHAVLKQVGGERYVFSVSMANAATTARFSLRGLGDVASVEVLGEGRDLSPRGGGFEDAFEPYAVHLYRLR